MCILIKESKLVLKHFTRVLSFALLTLLFFTGCSLNKPSLKFSNEVFIVVDNIEKSKSEISYEDYLNITVKEPEIIPNLKNELPEGKSYKVYNILFLNSSKVPITIACKIFFPEELSSLQDTIPLGSAGAPINLEPQMTFDLESILTVKDYEVMSPSEKKLYDKYSKNLYFEVLINGKYDCFEIKIP